MWKTADGMHSITFDFEPKAQLLLMETAGIATRTVVQKDGPRHGFTPAKMDIFGTTCLRCVYYTPMYRARDGHDRRRS